MTPLLPGRNKTIENSYTMRLNRFNLSSMKTIGKLAAWILLPVCCFAQAQSAKPLNWVASWATAQQIPEPQNALAVDDLRDGTLRQIVHLSVGGPTLRVHLSNAFGTEPLHLASVHIARRSMHPRPRLIPPLTSR